MQKIACVFSYRMSSWVSCQKIVLNLHKAYQRNTNLELVNFNYSEDAEDVDKTHLAHSIYKANPDRIVFMDHNPHPLYLLQFLLPMYKGQRKPQIIFHVFGDFTIYYLEWHKLVPLLEEFKVTFIVASDRQKILFDKFLNAPQEAFVCPFPVDKEEFHYAAGLRGEQRQRWGLSDKDTAYVFTGRLSRQKRIHTLISSFAAAYETTKSPAHLFLYGNPDNIGDHFLSVFEVEGEYFRKIHRLYKSLPQEVQDRIHFMGNVPNIDLRAVYQGADYLVNISVHNDEDFGMSVAEAQASGLPSILTDWGGLASFEHTTLPEATRFVPVKIGKKSKVVLKSHFIEHLKDTMTKPHVDNRKAISDVALAKFGIETAHQHIDDILKHESWTFGNFSPFFEKIVTKIMVEPGLYMTDTKMITQTYRDIYSAYVRHH